MKGSEENMWPSLQWVKFGSSCLCALNYAATRTGCYPEYANYTEGR